MCLFFVADVFKHVYSLCYKSTLELRQLQFLVQIQIELIFLLKNCS